MKLRIRRTNSLFKAIEMEGEKSPIDRCHEIIAEGISILPL